MTTTDPRSALVNLVTDPRSFTAEELVELYAASASRDICAWIVRWLEDRIFTDDQLALYCHEISYADPLGTDEAWKRDQLTALRATLAGVKRD